MTTKTTSQAILTNGNNTAQTKTLIIGQGAIGLPVACALARQGVSVVAVARSAKNYPADTPSSLEFWQQDALSLTASQLADVSCIAIIVAPSASSQTDRVQAYRQSYLHICQHIAQLSCHLPKLKQVLFVSSTSVYADTHELIDVHRKPDATALTAQVLIRSEQVLQQAFGKKTVIVRASGIYGVNRLRLVRQAMLEHQPPVSSVHWTNRIMDTDLVKVLTGILMMSDFKPVYLATDFCPATSEEVLRFIRQQMMTLGGDAVKLSGTQEKQANKTTQYAKQAPSTGKKIISNLPKDWLEFGDYRQGYGHIIKHILTVGDEIL